MVFQDGLQYDAPVVFDNLIAKKEVPPMVGVFVMHGRVKALSEGALDRMNRSFEYDSITDDYARFLLEELLPTWPRSTSSASRPTATTAPSREQQRRQLRVHRRLAAARRVPSRVQRDRHFRGHPRGRHLSPDDPQERAKPIRVFLQDGRNDLDNPHGSWWIANQDMLSALQYAGYDVRHEWGEGEHNGRHAKAIFPTCCAGSGATGRARSRPTRKRSRSSRSWTSCLRARAGVS